MRKRTKRLMRQIGGWFDAVDDVATFLIVVGAAYLLLVR